MTQNVAFNDNIFVKIGAEIKTKEDYTFSKDRKNLIFDVASSANTKINIITLDVAGTNVLDFGTFVGDGSSIDFLTNVRWTRKHDLLCNC